MQRIPVVVVGASGYTGAELLRLLMGHPAVEIAGVYAKKQASQRISDIFPQFSKLLDHFIELFSAEGVIQKAEVVFCALPHGESAPVVASLWQRNAIVIDLSADFRLRDTHVYAEWYGNREHPVHPHPELLDVAVCGFPEHYRQQLRGARLIAMPGCYPTAAFLALSPLLERGLIVPRGIIIDAKSGASGVGRTPSLASHFPEMGEGIRPYRVGGIHRHTPEMIQELSRVAGRAVTLTFTPHLVPMSRGLLLCAYADPTDPNLDETVYRNALTYAHEPFVTLLPPGKYPDTTFVRGTNRAHLQVVYDRLAGKVVVICAIDNLGKGASAQAIQVMNCTLGLEETLGLEGVALFP